MQISGMMELMLIVFNVEIIVVNVPMLLLVKHVTLDFTIIHQQTLVFSVLSNLPLVPVLILELYVKGLIELLLLVAHAL